MKVFHCIPYIFLALSSSAVLIACSNDNQTSGDETIEPVAIEQGESRDLENSLTRISTSELDHYTVENMEQLLQAIHRTAGAPRAESLESCQLLEVGAKPCGGPERLVLYSTEVADVAQLKALAARYTELAHIRNERSGLVSDCAVITRPRLSLEGGLCIPRALVDQ